MYDEILQAVIAMASAAAGVPVYTGSNPPMDSIAMTGQASTSTDYLALDSNEQMNVVCNGKNGDQQTVIRQLDAIHTALTRRRDFPSGENWQIYAIERVASPRLIGREQNPRAQWLYGSSLRVKFYVKGSACQCLRRQ